MSSITIEGIVHRLGLPTPIYDERLYHCQQHANNHQACTQPIDENLRPLIHNRIIPDLVKALNSSEPGAVENELRDCVPSFLCSVHRNDPAECDALFIEWTAILCEVRADRHDNDRAGRGAYMDGVPGDQMSPTHVISSSYGATHVMETSPLPTASAPFLDRIGDNIPYPSLPSYRPSPVPAPRDAGTNLEPTIRDFSTVSISGEPTDVTGHMASDLHSYYAGHSRYGREYVNHSSHPTDEHQHSQNTRAPSRSSEQPAAATKNCSQANTHRTSYERSRPYNPRPQAQVYQHSPVDHSHNSSLAVPSRAIRVAPCNSHASHGGIPDHLHTALRHEHHDCPATDLCYEMLAVVLREDDCIADMFSNTARYLEARNARQRLWLGLRSRSLSASEHDYNRVGGCRSIDHDHIMLTPESRSPRRTSSQQNRTSPYVQRSNTSPLYQSHLHRRSPLSDPYRGSPAPRITPSDVEGQENVPPSSNQADQGHESSSQEPVVDRSSEHGPTDQVSTVNGRFDTVIDSEVRSSIEYDIVTTPQGHTLREV